MLSVRGRKPAAIVVEPVARGMLRLGLSANLVTVIGAAVGVLLAAALIPTGHLVWAAILIGVCTVFDMVDGTMARLSGGGTSFGSTLDASCDRITDGALFAAITWWLIYSYDAPKALVAASFTVLVSSQVISYIKARAEAGGISIVGGIIERPERLIIALVGLGLQGFGVPYAIDVAMWVLLVGSVITIVQRFGIAARSKNANRLLAPPPGARVPTAKRKDSTGGRKKRVR